MCRPSLVPSSPRVSLSAGRGAAAVQRLSSGVVSTTLARPSPSSNHTDPPADSGQDDPEFGALPAAIIKARRWIAALWAVAVLALLPAVRRVDSVLDVAGNRSGTSEAAEVERRLGADFASPYARYAILVMTGIPSPDSATGRAVLRAVAAAVGGAPGVARTVSYLSTRDTAFLGAHGSFMIVGLNEPRRFADDWIEGLRSVTATLQQQVRAQYPEATFAWTGNAALNYDFRAATTSDASRAERRIVPVTLVLLLAVFGSVVAACMPLLAAGLAIVVSLGLAVLLVYAHWPLSVVLRNSVSMLGLGAGIDYALLVVSRFREGLAHHRTPISAAEYAVYHAGHTVVLSAAAVVIAFAALLSVPASELRSIATGGLLVVTTSALLATTLLPGILAWLGPRVDALHIASPDARPTPGSSAIARKAARRGERGDVGRRPTRGWCCSPRIAAHRARLSGPAPQCQSPQR